MLMISRTTFLLFIVELFMFLMQFLSNSFLIIVKILLFGHTFRIFEFLNLCFTFVITIYKTKCQKLVHFI
jgi:hypothetical protein